MKAVYNGLVIIFIGFIAVAVRQACRAVLTPAIRARKSKRFIKEK